VYYLPFVFYLLFLIFFINSPFLFVIGDDRVIRYMETYDDTDDVMDAQTTE